MMGFLLFIHVVTCILLMVVILMQSGRGGGLTESFASAESMFGAKTNEFMVKATMILAGMFLVTALSLAYLSSRQQQSLMTVGKSGKRAVQTVPFELPAPVAETAPTAPAKVPGTAPADQVTGQSQVSNATVYKRPQNETGMKKIEPFEPMLIYPQTR